MSYDYIEEADRGLDATYQEPMGLADFVDHLLENVFSRDYRQTKGRQDR